MKNMKQLGITIGSALVLLTTLVSLSSRHSVRELFGYARASADNAGDELEKAVPNAVRDQKLRNDLEQARGEIIDRRVKLNLATSEVKRLQTEIDSLAAMAKRRETILAEAYPALEIASNDRLTEVMFAGTKWHPTELGQEIDRLLAEQERDERQLGIRRDAMTRLVKSVEDGASALAEMETKLSDAANEFQTLVVRRDQAENESQLLDLVAAAGRTGDNPAATIGTNLDDLRTEVAKREARNDARRDTVPSTVRDASRLTQAWDRLERLKALHDKRSAPAPTVVESDTTTPTAAVAGK
jgi:hypothetical protein